MSNKDKKVTETKVETTKAKSLEEENKGMNNVIVRGILGIVLLAVFGSILFSTWVIWTGTDNPMYKIFTGPAALFDVFIAFVAFSKILK